MACHPSTNRRSLLWAALGMPLCVRAQPKRVPLFVGEGPRSSKVAQMLGWVAEHARFQWDIRPVPWTRGQKLAADGEGLMWGLVRTAERERTLRFSRALSWAYTWTVVRAGDRAPTTLNELSGKRLCMASGSAYPSTLRKHGLKDFQVENGIGDTSALRMLTRQRCDLTLVTLDSAQRQLALGLPDVREVHSLNLLLAASPLLANELHFATGHGSRWLWALDRIDEQAQLRDKEVQRLFR